MAKVSVITPVRDMRAHLAEAIASVQAQTVQDWEMLIIDDGSTDGSGEIAERAAQADRRIRVLAAPRPIGAAAARNLGLASARGAFVALLDADDLFEPQKLAVDLAALQAHDSAAMVYGPTLWWWPDGARPAWLESLDELAGRLHPPPRLFRRVVLEQAFVPCTCATLIRRSAMAEVGGFDESFRLYEDQTLWARLMLRWPVYVHAVPTSRYRQHAGSTSAQALRDGRYHDTEPREARAEFLAWAAREAEAAGRMDSGLRRAARLALAPYPDRRPRLSMLDHGVLLKRRLGSRAARLAHRLGGLAG